MAILTKFLQLLKPERNDYVDVEKHLSENYDKIDTKMEELSNSNDKKLDKGAVSSEYDTAKKIEDKIKKIINEKWKINTKYIGDTNTSTDFNSITANGTYYSSKYNALYTNGFLGANQRAYQEFKLIVIGENNDGAPVLKSQLVITRDDNIYLRSCTSWQAPWTWSEWEKIARMSDLTWGNIGGKPSSFPPSSHTHDDRYYTEAEINEKFKNFCPFPVSSLYLSLGNENPSTLWLGTTWQKQENRFLLGAGSSYNLGATGGSSTVTLSIDNLPSHNHSASTASHTHSQPAHTHTVYGYNYEDGDKPNIAGANGYLTSNPTTSSAGGDTTGSASPITTIGNTGNGQSFSIMPPYIAVNIWKRTS